MVGTIDLDLLYHFLHVLLYLYNLKSTREEFRGINADKIKVENYECK
jgi:hypothetical protein